MIKITSLSAMVLEILCYGDSSKKIYFQDIFLFRCNENSKTINSKALVKQWKAILEKLNKNLRRDKSREGGLYALHHAT